MSTGTLDSNDKGASAAELTLTTETIISFYIFAKTGTAGKYRVGIEASPDNGTTWVEIGVVLAHPGIHTCPCIATKVRAIVLEAQGETSTITVHILAR